jgi:putative redox protein
LRLRAEGTKVRDDGGNHLTDIVITFDVEFEQTDAGKAAQDVMPRAVSQSNDRLCTVSRTVQLGATVEARIAPVE